MNIEKWENLCYNLYSIADFAKDGEKCLKHIIKEDFMNNSEYYGKENPFESIKIIDYYNLDFSLGNVIKYVLRAGKKPGEDALKDLKKAYDYLGHKIELLSKEE